MKGRGKHANLWIPLWRMRKVFEESFRAIKPNPSCPACTSQKTEKLMSRIGESEREKVRGFACSSVRLVRSDFMRRGRVVRTWINRDQTNMLAQTLHFWRRAYKGNASRHRYFPSPLPVRSADRRDPDNFPEFTCLCRRRVILICINRSLLSPDKVCLN